MFQRVPGQSAGVTAGRLEARLKVDFPGPATGRRGGQCLKLPPLHCYINKSGDQPDGHCRHAGSPGDEEAATGWGDLPGWPALSSSSRPGPAPNDPLSQVLRRVLPTPLGHSGLPWLLPWLVMEPRDPEGTSGSVTWYMWPRRHMLVTSSIGRPFPWASRCFCGLGGHFVAGEGHLVKAGTQSQPLSKWG